jgi:hypothetical protein
MGRAKTGVFDNRGHRDARCIGRRKSNVERMIALALFHPGRVVAVLLANGDGLRRAGLAPEGNAPQKHVWRCRLRHPTMALRTTSTWAGR